MLSGSALGFIISDDDWKLIIFLIVRQPFLEIDVQLGADSVLVMPVTGPFLRDIHCCKIQDLHETVICRKAVRVPSFSELVHVLKCLPLCRGSLHFYEIRHQGPKLFVKNVYRAVTGLMDGTMLYFCLRESGFDRLGKACQAVYADD